MPRTFDPSASLGHWAARLSWAARGAMERRLRPLGVTPPMMAALLAVDAGMDRATQVAAHMGVDAAAVTRLLDRLSDAGLIGRCAAPGDRRGRSLSLSAKARALLPALARTADGLDRELAAQLGPGESARLLATLKKLSAAADRL